MKRNRDERRSKSDARVPVKRPKSNQACASCRRYKTRCEQLDGDLSLLRCHRCNVLNVACSFETLPHKSPSSSLSSPKLPSTRDPGFIQTSQLDGPSSQSVPLFPSMQPNDLTLKVGYAGPWGIQVPGGLDWTANPMLALQELVRWPHIQMGSRASPPPVLTMLNREQKKYLFDIFDSRYGPWMNLPSSQDDHTPFFDLARCFVAARHLDDTTRSILEPRLKDGARDALIRQMFSPTPTTDSIYALLVYSHWVQYDTVDARLLIASAVSMAMNLRLGLSSESAISLRKMQKREQGLSDENLQELATATEQARLWIALSNTESMLCLGTGRAPLSRRSHADANVLDIYSLSSVTHKRDVRLGLMSQLLDLGEHGISIRLANYDNLHKWHKEVLDVLMKMDSLHRVITPLAVVAEDDIFYFHMLLVYYFSCRLLVLHQALREARRVLSDRFADTLWYTHFVLNGVNIASAWGNEALMAAESVLVNLIGRSEIELIGAAPDVVFAFVCFAAIFLVMAKFSVFQFHNEKLTGSSDILLAKTIERLTEAAYSPDHCSARCARLISSSVASWKQRSVRLDPGFDDERAPTNNVPAAPAKAIVPEEPFEFPIDVLDDNTNHDFTRLMNSDIFFDNDFWSSFMSNLSGPCGDFSPQTA